MRPRRSLHATARAAVAVLSLTTAACGNDDSSSSSTTTAAASGVTTTTFAMPADELVDMTGKDVVEITSVDNNFEPRYVKVSAGARIVWRNGGRNNHDILPDVDGAFEGVKAADMPPGATHTVTLDQPGDYPYYCSTHGTMRNGMNGAIRVVPKG